MSDFKPYTRCRECGRIYLSDDAFDDPLVKTLIESLRAGVATAQAALGTATQLGEQLDAARDECARLAEKWTESNREVDRLRAELERIAGLTP